jgi:Secretion system C-terminal sorting domain
LSFPKKTHNFTVNKSLILYQKLIVMKKSILLFTVASSFAASVGAQEINSMLRPTNLTQPHYPLSDNLKPVNVFKDRSSAGARTSSFAYSEWFDLLDWTYTSGTSQFGYLPIYPDSTVTDTSSTGRFNIYIHGVGESFDPTDSSYFYSANTSLPATANPVNPHSGYELDSFAFYYNYERNNKDTSVIDSIIIELVRTSNSNTVDSGAYNLSYQPAGFFDTTAAADSVLRFADAIYAKNGSTFNTYGLSDSIQAPLQRYSIPLKNGSQYLDTMNGFQSVALGLTTPLEVGAFSNDHIVAFVHFWSGKTYAMNANDDTCNVLRLYASEPFGYSTWYHQSAHNSAINYVGSYQSGLWATNQSTSYETASNYTFGFKDTSGVTHEHNVLIPSYLYGNPPGFTVPYMLFHINWSNVGLGVQNVNATTFSAVAFPNPANGDVKISFDGGASNASYVVTLTNSIGQVVSSQTTVPGARVAIFNTSKMPSGVYYYSAKSDNGQSGNGQSSTGGSSQNATGKITVVH